MNGGFWSDLPIVSHIGSSLGKFLLLVNFCAKYGSCSVGVISCLAGMVVGFGTGMRFGLGGNAIFQIVCQLSDLVLDGFYLFLLFHNLGMHLRHAFVLEGSILQFLIFLLVKKLWKCKDNF